MEYGIFYDIANYANAAWNGGLTEKETAENAHIYACEWEVSKKSGKATGIIRYLFQMLLEDGAEEAREYAMQLKNSLGRLAWC